MEKRLKDNNKVKNIFGLVLLNILSCMGCFIVFDYLFYINGYTGSSIMFGGIAKVVCAVLIGLLFKDKFELGSDFQKDSKKDLYLKYGIVIAVLCVAAILYYTFPQIEWALSNALVFNKNMQDGFVPTFFDLFKVNFVVFSTVCSYIVCCVTILLKRCYKVSKIF